MVSTQPSLSPFHILCTSPNVHSNSLCFGYKSEIDLCATVIDRFLANMLEQMLVVGSWSGLLFYVCKRRDANRFKAECDLDYISDP